MREVISMKLYRSNTNWDSKLKSFYNILDFYEKNEGINAYEVQSFSHPDSPFVNNYTRMLREIAFITYKDKKRSHYSFQGEIIKDINHEYHKDAIIGGIIVFSTRANSKNENRATLLNMLKYFFKNNYTAIENKVLQYIRHDVLFNKVQCFSAGNFFKLRFFDRKTGMHYNEKSLSVEIIGIPIEILLPIAKELCLEFKKNAFLLKDYATGKIILVSDI